MTPLTEAELQTLRSEIAVHGGSVSESRLLATVEALTRSNNAWQANTMGWMERAEKAEQVIRKAEWLLRNPDMGNTRVGEARDTLHDALRGRNAGADLFTLQQVCEVATTFFESPDGTTLADIIERVRRGGG